MNKTAIKNFAIWARNKLIADISYRAGLMGITADGIHAALPQSTGQTEFYDIGTAEPYAITGEAIRQRKHLVELIQRKEKDIDYKTAYKYIIEEVAYTWFNRLIAVRFMEVNDYLPSHIRVLSSDTGKLEPDLVTTPFDAELEFTRDEQQTVLDLKNANKLDEVFRLLFIKQCNSLNEILPALFEKTNDYTELLLNLSVIDQDGVVYHLVHDIPEEDFDVERGGQVEIIGWLYQYYNSEPKEQVFSDLKKNIKISKEKIPAATQLFTPDWIVRYMVENSLGRLWVEGHPNDELKAGWKYYLEEAEQEQEVEEKLSEIRAEYARLNPEDIKVIDPCMGSGHILVYAFDVLMQIYESAGYGQRDAARSILENNLYGLDIDDRAFQMAYFAVMMKARQYNRRILNGEYKPNVYSIQESNGINRDQLKYLGAGLNKLEKNNAITQMNGLLDTFKDAKEYGSILNVDRYDWSLLENLVSSIEIIGQLSFEVVGLDETAEQLLALIKQGKVLSQSYHVTTTNPPYMGSSGMSGGLGDYIKKHYPNGKADLFSCFIEKAFTLCNNIGFTSLITMESWMFLSSFSNLRSYIHSQKTITNMVHMPYLGKGGTSLGINFGTSAMVTRNYKVRNYSAQYEYTVYYETDDDGVPFVFPTINSRWKTAIQEDFSKIPGAPIAYWISHKIIDAFDRGTRIEDIGSPKQGMIPGNVTEFLRLWYEVRINKIGFNHTDHSDIVRHKYKWFPYNKGGAYRRWAGNIEYVINMENDGYAIKYSGKNNNYRLREPELYFKEAVTWPKLTTGGFSARYMPAGNLFDIAGCCVFFLGENLKYILGFMNSKVCDSILDLISPTMNYEVEHIKSLPILFDDTKREIIGMLVQNNIAISTEDWDAVETSWNFKRHPLVDNTNKSSSIEEAFNIWKESCETRFNMMKTNEEELNRLFIEIYSLDGEMSPEVNEASISVQKADKQREVKSLISFAVGCMFGRYSLDLEGLTYAGGEWDERKYIQFKPDTDSIIPITDEEYLEDDVVTRLCTWLKVVYGEQTLEENLDFIAKALGNKGNSSRDIIREYFLNDFFKDHCQTYSVTGSGKRPIYWLFDSGKQNGFKALIYLHRYNADTIGNLRVDYLHRMQRIYESEISRMQDMIDHSTNAREVAQATKRHEKLTKQLKECREYDEKLAHLALSRIELDLDDGVKVNYRKIQTANDGKFYEVLADSKNIMAKK